MGFVEVTQKVKVGSEETLVFDEHHRLRLGLRNRSIKGELRRSFQRGRENTGRVWSTRRCRAGISKDRCS